MSETSCHALLVFKGNGLDQAKLIRKFSMKPVRPKKKGDRLGNRPGYPAPLAATGYCGFSTSECISSKNINDHVSFLLEEISRDLVAIREIVRNDHLYWEIVCFIHPEQQLKLVLNESNVIRSKEIGVRIVSDDSSDAVTFVWDNSAR